MSWLEDITSSIKYIEGHLLLLEVPRLLKMKKGIKNAYNFGQTIIKWEKASIYVVCMESV